MNTCQPGDDSWVKRLPPTHFSLEKCNLRHFTQGGLSRYITFCLVLSGDQASRKGTLTGGYYDNRLSRLELQRRKQKTEMEIQETENVRENNAKRKEQVDAQINRIIDEAQRKETVQSKLEYVNAM